MKFLRKPKWAKDIDAEYGLGQFETARAWFYRRGVQCGYSTIRRSWFFSAIGRANGPTTVICWCGLATFIDMLDAPAQTLKDIAAKGGNVAKRLA